MAEIDEAVGNGGTTSGDLIPVDASVVDENERRRSRSNNERPWREAVGGVFDTSHLGNSRTVWVMFALAAIGMVAAVLDPNSGGWAGVAILAGVFVVALVWFFMAARGLIATERLNHIFENSGMSAHAKHLAFVLIEDSPVPCLISGIDGNAFYMNAAYRDFFNISERVPVSLEQMFASNEVAGAAVYRLARAARSGLTKSEDVHLSGDALDVLRERHGGSRWVRVKVRSVEANSRHFLWEVEDVTEEKTLSEAEKVDKEALSDLLNRAPGGILCVNHKGTIRSSNEVLANWLGLTAQSLSGGRLELEEIFSQPKLALEVLEELKETGEGQRIVALRGCDGEALDVLVSHARFSTAQSEGNGDEVMPVDYYTFSRLDGMRYAGAMQVAGGNEVDGFSEGFAEFVDAAPIPVMVVDAAGRLLKSNHALSQLVPSPILPGDPIDRLMEPEDKQAFLDRVSRVSGGETIVEPYELRFSGKEERSAQVFASVANFPVPEGMDGPAVVLYWVETTEQKLLEMQFAQSQKMQAVGQLAGGVAHDFNNVLTAIIGYCDLLIGQHPIGDPSFADINQIRQNANRAANLVRQLLAFSRKQTLVPKVLNLVDAIAETRNLLDRLLGERVELRMNHQRDLGLVKVDQGQLEQVIVNLAVNARDAMTEDGKLTISTYNVSEDESRALGHTLMPEAEYVCLEISDTGCGISKESLGKVFEPFFTTKDVGEGTGLGLSTVYGIIKQTGGYIFPESEVGVGTTFRIYLPRYHEEEGVEVKDPEKTEVKDLTGAGTILLVEDEDAVRSFAARALTSRGYNVLEAANGELALEYIEDDGDQIDLIVTDVVMPAMDGPTMAKKAKELNPGVKIIFISGYAEDAFKDDLDRPEDFVFLPKPFSLKQLAAKVKEVITA